MSRILDDFRYAWNRPNNAVAQLIIINVLLYVGLIILTAIFSRIGSGEVSVIINNQFRLPSNIEEFIVRPWTIITYAFNHGGLGHIFFNMITLFWFGRLIQEFLGSQKLINLYIISALSGALIYLFVYNVFPNMPLSEMVGASGAIYGIMIAAAVLVPDYKFHLIFIGPVKILYIALFSIFISAFAIEQGSNLGGNLAHLAGAGMGYLYIKQLQRGNEMGVWVFKLMEFVKNIFKPKPKIKVSHRKSTSSTKKAPSSSNTPSPKSTVSQEEIDKILDKISERGYESLSKDEKEKLFNASKK